MAIEYRILKEISPEDRAAMERLYRENGWIGPEDSAEFIAAGMANSAVAVAAYADGELVGQVRDVAYQATTTDFWGSMEAVGGPQTWELGGAFNCGKAQPGQVAAVSHGCPTSLFRGVRILNTLDEAGH